MMDDILSVLRDGQPIDSVVVEDACRERTETESEKLKAGVTSPMQQQDGRYQNSEQLYQKEVAKLITDIRQAHCHKNNILDGLETEKSIKDQSELEDIGMSENDFEDLKRRVRMQEASRRYRKRKKATTRSQREEMERLKRQLRQLQYYAEQSGDPEHWQKVANTEKKMQAEQKHIAKIRNLVRAIREAQRDEKKLIRSIGSLIQVYK
ncbi:unnamed protein product [Albugo candida]|nr:unnamed protein product [Albugo candida]|eukprot:CCI47917.1 unnamed protein product [Albugo candida]